MKFFVASENPVKIQAIANAVAQKFSQAEVQGFAVASGVADQPLTDQETKQGAINRAYALRATLIKNKIITVAEEALFIGLEGGVFHPKSASNKNELWSTVWVAALDQHQQLYLNNGARFPLPQFLAQMILDGQEMGPALGAYAKEPNLRQQAGAIGYLTNNFTNRTAEYAAVAKIALGLWYKVYQDSSVQNVS